MLVKWLAFAVFLVVGGGLLASSASPASPIRRSCAAT